VGYTGGEKKNPTYYSLGDHTETLQIDYDPSQLSYSELLAIFWESHNPRQPPWSRQYMSAIFYHNEEEKKLALQTKEQVAAKIGREVFTPILAAAEFYLAEDYHQKYRLQQKRDFMKEFDAIYPNHADFVNSRAATRVNGYLAGYGSLEALQGELERLGLSEKANQQLLDTMSRGQQ
jgi:peptide-methionine (S)-S-oxide reductase